MLEKGLQLKTSTLLCLENLYIVDLLIISGNKLIFSDFQYGFWSSCSTANVLTVVTDKIKRVFNRSGTTWTVALDISKAFGRIWHPGVLHELNAHVIWGQVFLPDFVISWYQYGFRLAWTERVCKIIWPMPVFLKALFLVLLFPTIH